MLTADRLRKLLDYDPETGFFTRKTRHNRMPIGARSGATTKGGYRIIAIDGRRYYEHRLAWLFVTGKWPSGIIDHIDLNRANNAFANLREATNGENMRNGSVRKDSVSGSKGVCWHRPTGKWRAYINVGGRQKYLGTFASVGEAAEAYDVAALMFFGAFARPNSALVASKSSPRNPRKDIRNATLDQSSV